MKLFNTLHLHLDTLSYSRQLRLDGSGFVLHQQNLSVSILQGWLMLSKLSLVRRLSRCLKQERERPHIWGGYRWVKKTGKAPLLALRFFKAVQF